jgi:hypothetical protein
MEWSALVSCFFGGALLTNAVPHLVSGVTGRPFQTPFATPPGRGLSSSIVKVLWGVYNLAAGYVILRRVDDVSWTNNADAAALGLGVLAMGLFCAFHFGRLHGGQRSDHR